MRSLTEIKGDDALELIADLLEPVTEITADEKVKNAYQSENIGSAIKVAIKEHKTAVIAILAALNECDVKDYNPSVAQIVKDALAVVNDRALLDLFTYPNQKSEENTSGSVSESSEEEG